MRWLVRIVLALAILVECLAIAVRTAPVQEAIRARAVVLLADALGAQVRIAALHGSIFRDVVLDDVEIVVDGRPVLTAPRITLAYHVLPLLHGELRIARAAVDAPRVRLVRTARGWQLPSPPPSEGSTFRTVVVDDIAIRDGRVAGALLDVTPPRRLAATALALDASARIDAAGESLVLRSLTAVPRGVALGPLRAAADVATSGDHVRVDGLDVATSRSHVTASGVVETGARVDAALALEPLAARDVRAVVPALTLRADVRGDASARGPWDAIDARIRTALAPGGDLTASARIDAAATPLRWDAHADLAALDPGAALAGLEHATLTGDVAARGAGLALDGLGDYWVSLHDSTVADRTIDRLELTGTARDGVHRVRGRVRAAAGAAAVRARVALHDPIAYVGAVRYRVARLELLAPATWGWAAGTAHVHGRGTAPNARSAVASVVVTRAAVHGLPFDAVELGARLADERVTADRVRVRSDDLGLDMTASGRGGLDGRGIALDATARVDLDAVGRYLAKPLRGGLTLDATVRGDLGSLTASADATLRGAAWASTSADTTSARVDLTGLGGPAAAGYAKLTASGARAGAGPAYGARGDVDWRRRGDVDRVDVTLAADAADGRTQRARAAIERTPARTTATVQDVQLAPGDGSVWRLVAPAILRIDSAVSTDGLVLADGPQRVALRGRVALDEGTSDATLTADALALASICPIVGGPKCAGALSGRAAVGGTPTAPVLTLTFAAREVAIENVAYGGVELRGDYADRRLKVAATLRHPDAGMLSLDGVVPVDLAWAGAHPDLARAPLSLALRARALDLTFVRALAPWTIRRSAGRVDVDLGATGTRAAPQLRGNATLADGTLELVATGIPYEHIRARLDADGTRLVARELHAEAGDGRADVTGSVELATAPRALDLQLHLDKFFAVRATAYEAAVSGDVRLLGTLDAPDVSGRVAVDHATIRPAALPSSGANVPQPDPTIVVIGAPVSEQAARPSLVPSLAANTRVAVTITIERNAWIRRSDADIEIGGKLEVTKAPDDGVRIVGEIRLLRGWYDFQDRRFTIDPGSISRIDFAGQSPPQPTFDITAVYNTRDYRILVHVGGSAEKPTLELTSEPALDQADILSVLLFGKPAHDLRSNESAQLQQKALALAAGYVVPELRSSVMNALGVQTLDVQMPEGTVPGRVSAGRYVAEDVFVSLGQEFGSRAAQVVGLEYYLGRNISVRGSTSTRGDSGLDLIWRWRY